MTTLRIGLDLDGCLADGFDNVVGVLLEEHWGITLEPSQYWNHIRDQCGEEAWKWLWDEGVREHGLFRHQSLVRGAVIAVRKLADEGHQLVYITHRPREASEDTVAWLAHHRFPVDELHITQEPKSSVVPRCDVYLDDSPSVCEDLLRNTDGFMAVRDRPWNQEFRSPVGGGRYFRVKTWEEFASVVNRKRFETKAG